MSTKKILCENAEKRAFTLAEALIALVVVGIVAAVTVPTLANRYAQRVNSERHANIVYKMATAMHNMKNQGELEGKFDTTMDFVNRLKRYIKIDKICKSDKIAECWPTKSVITWGGEKYDVSNAKTRGDIITDANAEDNPNVGIILADGANLILTYNPDYDGLNMGDTIEYSPAKLPIDKGLEEYKEYSNNAMEGLAFIFDVNGNSGPNKEQTGKVGGITRDVLDIRGFHGAHFIPKNAPEPEITGCAKFSDFGGSFKIEDSDGTCYFDAGGTSYTWYQAREMDSSGNPLPAVCPPGSENYSKKSTSYSTLLSKCNSLLTYANSSADDSVTWPFSGQDFWSSQEYNSSRGYYVFFYSGSCNYGYSGGDKANTRRVLCAGK